MTIMNSLGHKFEGITWVVVGFDTGEETELAPNNEIERMAMHVVAGMANITDSPAAGVLTLKSEIYYGCGLFELSRERIPISRVRVVWNDRRSAEQWALVRMDARGLRADEAPPRQPPMVPWVAELHSERFGEIPIEDVWGISDATCAIACAMLRVAQGAKN